MRPKFVKPTSSSTHKMDEIFEHLEKIESNFETKLAALENGITGVSGLVDLNGKKISQSIDEYPRILEELTEGQKSLQNAVKNLTSEIGGFHTKLDLVLNLEETITELGTNLTGLIDDFQSTKRIIDRLGGVSYQEGTLAEIESFATDFPIHPFPDEIEKQNALIFLEDLKNAIQYFFSTSEDGKISGDPVLNIIANARKDVYEVASGMTPSINSFSRFVSSILKKGLMYDKEELEPAIFGSLDQLVEYHQKRPVAESEE